jgi:hypothetical protein
MAYADKPKPPPGGGGAPDALLVIGEGGDAGAGGGEHEAKLDAFRRMKAAPTEEEGVQALTDFIRLCKPSDYS